MVAIPFQGYNIFILIYTGKVIRKASKIKCLWLQLMYLIIGKLYCGLNLVSTWNVNTD